MDWYHIIKIHDVWKFRKEGAARAIKMAQTKDEIVTLAGEFLNDRAAFLKIHKEDGVVEAERTYPPSLASIASEYWSDCQSCRSALTRSAQKIQKS